MEAVTPISGKNRAFNYGDGCFTTIAVFNHTPQLLLRHIQRLEHDAKVLGIGLGDSIVHGLSTSLTTSLSRFAELSTHITALAQQSPAKCVIKVLVTRGDGGRGYGVEGVGPSMIYLSVFDWPPQYDVLQENGLTMGVSSIQLAKQPRLAGLKHLNRLEQVLIKQELATLPVDDVLVLDSQENIVEASAANVFWRLRDSTQWQTPSVQDCGVNGVYRQHIIAESNARDIDVKCVAADLDIVNDIESMFTCNALMGIVPVTSLFIHGREQVLNAQAVIELQKLLKEFSQR